MERRSPDPCSRLTHFLNLFLLFMKHNIIAFAKERKNDEYYTLVQHYLKRLSHYQKSHLSFLNPKSPTPFLDYQSKFNSKMGHYFILLDEKGKSLTTLQFSKCIEDQMNSGVKEIHWCIGPFDGFKTPEKKQASLLLSLSPLTLPHRLALLVLTEQIYRGVSILKGSNYHYE